MVVLTPAAVLVLVLAPVPALVLALGGKQEGVSTS